MHHWPVREEEHLFAQALRARDDPLPVGVDPLQHEEVVVIGGTEVTQYLFE